MSVVRCYICKKTCDPKMDRNSDGSHAHDDCLRTYMVQPVAKGEKGGNLYQGGRG